MYIFSVTSVKSLIQVFTICRIIMKKVVAWIIVGKRNPEFFTESIPVGSHILARYVVDNINQEEVQKSKFDIFMTKIEAMGWIFNKLHYK